MSEYGLCENGKVMVMRIEREMLGNNDSVLEPMIIVAI